MFGTSEPGLRQRLAVTALLIVVISGSVANEGHDAQAAPTCPESASRPELSTATIQTGTLAPGGTTCFQLPLTGGELARVQVAAGRGYLRGRILSPDGVELQRTWTSSFAFAAPSPVLTIEAPSTGLYVVELSVPSWVTFKDAQAFRIHIGSREPASARSARREQRRRDPRIAWLASNAKPLRDLDPNGALSDLEFLREQIGDARVVFIGEGDNGGGSDILAKTRLVRFLHERMGFDVLAFQTSIYSSVAGWQAARSSSEVTPAFDAIMPRLLTRAAQAEPLMRYVAAAARTSRPLELTGFDSQFSAAASSAFLPGLHAFLRTAHPKSILLDASAAPSRLLTDALAARIPRPGTPAAADHPEALAAIRREAALLMTSGADGDSVFWGQALRSAAAQVELLIESQRGAGDTATLAALARQLAENLIWLAEHRYAGRKIVVWAHTVHGLRDPEVVNYGRGLGFTVGAAVTRALESRVFVIGLTSYDGKAYFVTQPEDYFQNLIPNQHPDDSFETLMAAAGHEIAFVSLRDARARNVWLGGSFVANALHLVPEDAEWSRALDALLFIRTQQPRQRAAR